MLQFGTANDQSIATNGTILQAKNVHVTGVSESMMSQQHGTMFSSAILRRKQDKHVRNFKYLYEE